MNFLSRICFTLLLVHPVGVTVAQKPAWIDHVGVRALHIPDTTFNVADYGAVSDGKTLNTIAIQASIDACAAAGGGRVVFNKGTYLTGALYLKSGVQLHVDKGVTLLGSQQLADYPEVPTRVAGIEMEWPSALINILHQRNAAVTGEGVIDAQGKPFWDAYWALRDEYDRKKLRWIADYDAKRPRTLLVDDCQDILIEDITFQRAAFWTVHILYSSYVTIDGIVVQNNIGGHGPSTDGIDIDSSSWILVQNADIDCNDDNFCIKAGRDWDGLRVNRPTEYVLIQHCISRNGAGLISFGSETSGGMRHILARHLHALGTRSGIRFKSATTRGGVVEDIQFEHITMDRVGTAIEVTANWYPSYSYAALPKGYSMDKVPKHWVALLEPVIPKERGIPTFRNISISHLNAKNVQRAIDAEGLKESPLQHFSLKNIYIQATNAGAIDYAENWQVSGVTIHATRSRKIRIRHSHNVPL